MKRRNFLWYSLLFTAGCTAVADKQNSSYSTIAGRRPEKLRFAVTDLKGLEEVQREYGAFRIALEEVLETKIEFFPVENYIAAAPALQSNQVDLVLAGPSEYVILNARAKAIPVVAIQRPNYRSMIAVRADRGIKSLADLKGKTIAMGDVGATSSHLGPTKILMDAGLDPKSDFKIIMLGKKSTEALKNGDVDAWAGAPHRYEKLLQTKGVSKSDFPLIATGPFLPNDVFIANSKLAPGFVEKIRELMLQHQEKLIESFLPADNNKYKGSKLVLVNDADYNMVREVYKAIGQDDFI